jgi:hypothetical protein
MTEFAGAIEIDPPLTSSDIAYVRRSAEGERSGSVPWHVTGDGTLLKARGDADVSTALASLRLLVGSVVLPTRFRGTVAVYDPETRALVALTASNGRVTVRTLRKGRSEPFASNVVPLASRRGATTRAI